MDIRSSVIDQSYSERSSQFQGEDQIRDFEERTGVKLAVKFDAEATKSLGLVQQIVREEANPRCEVFWNNELLGTIDLAERGLLLPHKGSGFERMPDRFKDGTHGKKDRQSNEHMPTNLTFALSKRAPLRDRKWQ